MIKFKLFGPFFLWVGKCGFWCNKNDRDEFSMTPFSVDVSGWITWGTAGELNALLKSSGITFRPPSKLRWWEGDVASDAFMIYICFIVIRLKNICPLDLLIENPLSKAMIFTGKPLKIMILGIPGYIYIYLWGPGSAILYRWNFLHWKIHMEIHWSHWIQVGQDGMWMKTFSPTRGSSSSNHYLQYRCSCTDVCLLSRGHHVEQPKE